MVRITILVLWIFLFNICLRANEYKANPSNFTSFLSKLKPGDILLLEEGVYKKNLELQNLNGKENEPIVIQGVSEKTEFIGNAGENTVNIINCSYIEIKNLTIDGKNIEGIDGIKMGSSGVCHHILLENNVIQNYAATQQSSGISTKVPTWNITIRKNKVVNVGTGMYLGNSDGTQPFVAGLIEKNLFINTIGYNCEIKHQKNRSGVLVSEPTNQTIIRNNVFCKEKKGEGITRGDRPNLLIGHCPTSGAGSNDSYIIYNNFFYQNVTEEYLFQGEGNIYFFNNVLINKHGGGANFSAHNDKPKNIRVFFNTILSTGRSLFLSGEDGRFKQVASGNALFCDMSMQFSGQSQNLVFKLGDAKEHLISPFDELGKLNVCPLPSKLKVGNINTALLDGVIGSAFAFNESKRSGSVAGAFEPAGDMSGWNLDLTFLKTKSIYETLAGDDKSLLLIVEKIKRELRFDLLVKDLESIAKDSSPATEILNHLLDTEKEALQSAEDLIAVSKAAAYDKLEDLEKRWLSHEIGIKAKSLKDGIKTEALKEKREVQMAEYNAALMLKKIKASVATLRPVNGKRDLSNPDFRKLNQQSLRVISKYLEGLIEKYPDTSSTAEAKQLLEETKE